MQRAERLFTLQQLILPFGFTPGLFAIYQHPGLHPRLELLDPCETMFHQIARREPPLAHLTGRLGDARQFGHHAA